MAPLLPLLQAHLAHVEALAARDDAAALRRLVGAADEVVAAIDATALAAAFGITLDKDDEAAAADPNPSPDPDPTPTPNLTLTLTRRLCAGARRTTRARR